MNSKNQDSADDLEKLWQFYCADIPGLNAAMFEEEESAWPCFCEGAVFPMEAEIEIINEAVGINLKKLLAKHGFVEDDEESWDLHVSSVDHLKLVNVMLGIQLEKLITAYESGNNSALLKVIDLCIQNTLPAPEQIMLAFHQQLNDWRTGRVKSLDQAFGVEDKKGEHASSRGTRILMRYHYGHVIDRLGEGYKTAINSKRGSDVDAFEQAGREFGLCSKTAKDYFYKYRNEIMPEEAKLMKDTLAARSLKLREDAEYLYFVRSIANLPPKS